MPLRTQISKSEDATIRAQIQRELRPLSLRTQILWELRSLNWNWSLWDVRTLSGLRGTSVGSGTGSGGARSGGASWIAGVSGRRPSCNANGVALRCCSSCVNWALNCISIAAASQSLMPMLLFWGTHFIFDLVSFVKKHQIHTGAQQMQLEASGQHLDTLIRWYLDTLS